MMALVLVAFLSPCPPEAVAVLATAASRAQMFDMTGALARARAAGDCDEANAAVEYLDGLLAAREAAKVGGTDESLRDVRSAVNALSRRAETEGAMWEIASLVLRAAAAAAQYEREEMAIFLAEATRREQLRRLAGQPPIPYVSAHEVAGDLWLQVHRFEDARRAYLQAQEQIGGTGRVRLGLAQVAARLKDREAACREYRSFDEWWGDRPDAPAEVEEARNYLRSAECTPP